MDLPAGTNTHRLAVPDGTDREVYYTATLIDNGYEDFRMLTSNSLSEPVREDNRAPVPAIEVVTSLQLIRLQVSGPLELFGQTTPLKMGMKHIEFGGVPHHLVRTYLERP